MVKFLIHKPVAVGMTFLALVIFGTIASFRLPVSLLPDVKIPKITVYAHYPDYDAKEFHEIITQRIIRRLRQCYQLDDIHGETEDGKATIHLTFEFGIDPDLAGIEVNEKIDLIMSQLPRDMERPKVIKSSAVDLPVFYLNLNLKDPKATEKDFLELSQLTKEVIAKRLEHLSEVAFVDISGLRETEIVLSMNPAKCTSLGIFQSDIERIFNENNISFGTIEVEQGNYRYPVRFESSIDDIRKIRDLYINLNGKLIQLKEIAEITLRPKQKTGRFLYNGSQAISMAITMQPSTQIKELKESVKGVIKILSKQFPQIQFTTSQDQTELLSYSIQNLKWSLICSMVLTMLVIFSFHSSYKLPILILIVIPASVLITLLFFYLLGISINIISLSGLILGLGLMIDNAIVVVDSITQDYEKSHDVEQACVKGTKDVILPLLSSALTTTAVFVPLMFLSGIAGGLFRDQALAISIGLGISYTVSITLLPVLYFRLYPQKINSSKGQYKSSFKENTLSRVCIRLYEYGFKFIWARKYLFLTLFLVFTLLFIPAYQRITKEKFPSIQNSEIVLKINWNEEVMGDILVDRILEALPPLTDYMKEHSHWVGNQDYQLNRAYELSDSQSKLYLSLKDVKDIASVKKNLSAHFNKHFPKATYEFLGSESAFEHTFSSQEEGFEIRVHPFDEDPNYQEIMFWLDTLYQVGNERFKIQNPDQYVGLQESDLSRYFKEYYSISFNQERLALYEISLQQVTQMIRAKLNSLNIGQIHSFSQNLDVVIGNDPMDLKKIISETVVYNERGAPIPLRQLVKVALKKSLRVIQSGVNGEYISIGFSGHVKHLEKTEAYFRTFMNTVKLPFKFSFAGAAYQSETIIDELLIILLVAVILLYFILAAMFESLTQPIIILLEIPMDVGVTLFVLYGLGESLNVMSVIGLITMTGIIINDSILKIDTINRLKRYEDKPLIDAIKEAGKLRVKPILMTSLTTILAMVPFLFGEGLGMELQRPLAITVITGLGFGTLISLYFIPLTYWFLHRKESKKINN